MDIKCVNTLIELAISSLQESEIDNIFASVYSDVTSKRSKSKDLILVSDVIKKIEDNAKYDASRGWDSFTRTYDPMFGADVYKRHGMIERGGIRAIFSEICYNPENKKEKYGYQLTILDSMIPRGRVEHHRWQTIDKVVKLANKYIEHRKELIDKESSNIDVKKITIVAVKKELKKKLFGLDYHNKSWFRRDVEISPGVTITEWKSNGKPIKYKYSVSIYLDRDPSNRYKSFERDSLNYVVALANKYAQEAAVAVKI